MWSSRWHEGNLRKRHLLEFPGDVAPTYDRVPLELFAVSEAPDAASARRTVIQKAIDRSDLETLSAARWWSASSGGDYDPNGIARGDESSEE